MALPPGQYRDIARKTAKARRIKAQAAAEPDAKTQKETRDVAVRVMRRRKAKQQGYG